MLSAIKIGAKAPDQTLRKLIKLSYPHHLPEMPDFTGSKLVHGLQYVYCQHGL